MDAAVLDALRAELDRRVGLDALWVYGSVARGTDTAGSDVDLAALFARRPAAAELLSLPGDLAVLAGRDVDLVDLDTASPVIAMQVLREGRLLADVVPRRRIAFVSGLTSRYEDLRRLRQGSEAALLKRVVDGGA